MTEEIIKSGDNGKVQPETPNPEITLSIKFNQETGQLQVHAPGNGKLYDEPMCLWLLEKAKAFVFMANVRASQSKIIAPQPSMTQQVRGMFHRKH